MFVLSAYVAVIYLMYLICICVLAVLLTIIVQHLQLCSETKQAMPVWVSADSYLPQITLHRTCRLIIIHVIIITLLVASIQILLS